MANEQSHKKMKARILFTGSALRVIENLMEHISLDYEIEKCNPSSSELQAALKRFCPHVVVICLQHETRSELKAYNILDDSESMNHLILAVGQKDDCETLRRMLVSIKPILLGRPINMELFLSTLSEMTQKAISEEKLRAEEEEKAEKEKAEKEKSEKENEAEKEDTDKSTKMQKTDVNGRKSILVVDDDTCMLNTIKLYLMDLYDVTVVPSGKLALKFLSKKHADLVLLDYLMPEMNGPQVLDLIRTSTPTPDIPVLFLTGVADKDMILKTLEYKPNGYLLKPTTREALIERVMELLMEL